jgi:exonuclease III
MALLGASVVTLVSLVIQVIAIDLRGVSWNVNGVQKLKVANRDLQFLASFDIILLQETFSTTRDATLDLHGYIPHHQLGRRHQWGLSSLFKIETFTGGTLHRIACPVEWLIVSRWRQSTDLGLIVVNAYVPTHTNGFTRTDTDCATIFLRSLLDDFPSDGFILGGDLNVDTWRVSTQRNEGRVISSRTRLAWIPIFFRSLRSRYL